MNLESFKGPGSTASRRRFWDQVTAKVNASQKLAGRNVTVDEVEGMGSVINVADTSARRGGGGGASTGACCIGDTCSITTEAACIESGGTYQGNGTPCSPNPCCAVVGFPAFQNPDNLLCYTEISVACGAAPTYSGGVVSCAATFRTRTFHFEGCIFSGCTPTGSMDVVDTIDPDTCEITRVSCEGSIVFTPSPDCDGNNKDCDNIPFNDPGFTETVTLSDPF